MAHFPRCSSIVSLKLSLSAGDISGGEGHLDIRVDTPRLPAADTASRSQVNSAM